MYRIKLSDFEGPLDLLLFFIKRDELDIQNIPISRITRDFMEYLAAMQSLDLELAAEFIYMASVLMSIKAKMLLPKPELEEGLLDEFDPRADLVQRLLDYKRFKEMASEMQPFEDARRQLFARGAFEEFEAPTIDEDALRRPTLFELITAYRRVIERVPARQYHEIRKIPVTLEEQTEFLLARLKEKIQVSFFEVVGVSGERIVAVVTFLAVLEMAKNRQISIITKDDYNDFWMSLR
ncbi:MAG: segregation/condensation protein A [Rhizobacter sp.]|nr:segregation/condensation protein A [Chlorobiales bacterium]